MSQGLSELMLKFKVFRIFQDISKESLNEIRHASVNEEFYNMTFVFRKFTMAFKIMKIFSIYSPASNFRGRVG